MQKYHILSSNVYQNKEYFDLRLQTWFMETISHHIQYFRKNSHMILWVEFIGDWLIGVNVSKNFLEKVQTQICVGAKFVPQRPYYAI